MSTAPLPAPVLAALPTIARALGLILADLAAWIAHDFLRDPRRAWLIVPLWTRINRTPFT